MTKKRVVEQYLKDYVEGGVKLFWQRNLMYFGAFVLAVAYYDERLAVICYFLVLLSEAFEHVVARRIVAASRRVQSRTTSFYYLIHVGAILNAFAISAFVVAASIWEGEVAHFTPLFLLFSAALFAAMNTHQIVSALMLRLAIFGVAFVLSRCRMLSPLVHQSGRCTGFICLRYYF